MLRAKFRMQLEISAAISTLTAGVGGNLTGNGCCAFLKGIVFLKLVRKFPQRAFPGLSQAIFFPRSCLVLSMRPGQSMRVRKRKTTIDMNLGGARRIERDRIGVF